MVGSKKRSCFLGVHLLFSAIYSSCQLVGAFHHGPFQSQRDDHSSGYGVTQISGYKVQKKNSFDLELNNYYIAYNDIHQHNKNNDQIRTNRDIDTFTKDVLQEIAKRASYANSEEELMRWQVQDNEHDLVEVSAAVGAKLRLKRSALQENHVGGCVANISWILYDSSHFPRMLRSYNCSSTCNMGYGECHAKAFIIKVLKRRGELVTDESCDPLLPDELRCIWKFEPKNVTTYCECRSN